MKVNKIDTQTHTDEVEAIVARIKDLADEPISANLDASIRMALDENRTAMYEKGVQDGANAQLQGVAQSIKHERST